MDVITQTIRVCGLILNKETKNPCGYPTGRGKNSTGTYWLQIICREGLEFPSEFVGGRTICVNGSWSPPPSYCVPKSCQIPARLHVFFLKTKSSQILQANDVIEDGASANMVCLRGFHLSGNGVLECRRGIIINSLGRCLPKDCTLPTLTIGHFHPKKKTLLDRETITLQCSNLNTTITCNKGSLSPIPSCLTNSTSYCVPPRDSTPALIYRIQGLKRIDLDRFQTVYPNGTIFQYKCVDNREEASGIECINSEWISNLLPCIASNLTIWSPRSENDMCNAPGLERKFRIMNMDNYIHQEGHKFSHGTVLMIGCSIASDFDDVMEFKCRHGKWSKKNKINCDFEGTPCEFKVQLNSRTVTYHVEKKETVLFNQYFKEGSHLQFRCMNIGSERLKGKNEVVCRSGTWSHAVPFCVPLDPLNRNKDSPPILFDVVGGPYSISPTGELIVGRSATVSFSCFFPRKMGKVRWEVSSTYRSYSQIWTKLKALGIDKTDAYQLTVAVAQPEDSGLLHCIIPSGKRHTIKMRVDEGSCQPQQNSSHLYVYFTRRNFFIGTVAQFSCPSGFRIHGYTTSTCQADGTWTHPPPKCYATQCPPIAVDGKTMSVSISSFKFGGIAQFQCVKGFTLLGAEHIHCTSEGTWSDKIPSCSVVKCGKVIPPKNGFLIESTREQYQKGDIVLFGCLTNHILTGGDFVICQANGKWSEMLTKCDPYCRHPGRPSHGDSTAPAKDYYLVGEKIVFYCPSPEYKLNSENVLSCIGAGKWSRKVPLCLLANRN